MNKLIMKSGRLTLLPWGLLILCGAGVDGRNDKVGQALNEPPKVLKAEWRLARVDLVREGLEGEEGEEGRCA